MNRTNGRRLALLELLSEPKIIDTEPDGAGGGAVLVGAVGGTLALSIGREAAQGPGEEKKYARKYH